MKENPKENYDSSRLWAIVRAYRMYWMAPIVLGLALFILTLIFADSETLGRFNYFNF
jgi:hypothetical protein